MKVRFAEVRSVDDPNESGRVQIRLYGHDDDENNIKDEHLPWALCLMPITSASTNGIGRSPTGLIKGSRVAVVYAEDDHEEQYPIVLGSFHRATSFNG